MAKYIYEKENYVKINEPIIFENNTDSNFEVSAGIIFHKSGLYNVTVHNKHITVTKYPERKEGHWIDKRNDNDYIAGSCSLCGWEAHLYEDDVVGMNYCPNCGANMKFE